MGAPAIFEKPIEIKLSHPASTLESRIQVKDKRSIPASRCRDAVQFSSVSRTMADQMLKRAARHPLSVDAQCLLPCQELERSGGLLEGFSKS
ncbi:MAG: hypothetical protein P8X74_01725 [Reinekea sp.]